MRLVHVINPFNAPAGSPTHAALHAAHASIDLAARLAREQGIDLEIVAAIMPEDRASVPAFANRAVELTRALPDVVDIRPCRPLPLITDILRAGLADTPGDATDDDPIIVYTNSDIGVTPTFYPLLARLARDTTTFGIRRRNIDPAITDPAELALMLAQIGADHEGTDLFALPATAVRSLDVGHVAIGLPGIEHAVLCAADAHAGFTAKNYRNLHATFHHGDDRVWTADDELSAWNIAECRRIVTDLARAHPHFPAGSVFDTEQAKLDVMKPKAKSPVAKLQKALGLAPDRRWAEPFAKPPRD